MNCRTCQYELSQCLDGRLPSGRRAIVMEHTEACGACARFWSELQAAQHLVLRLRPQQVGAGFREQLFERISAGEGTPPAIFNEPIPLVSKMRYLLTGAAAAATVLLAANLVRGKTVTREADNPVALAPRDRLPVDFTPAIAGSPTASLLSAVKPLTTETLAVEAARHFKDRFDRANSSLARFDAAENADESTVRLVVDSAVELQEIGELLLDLHQHEQIFFSSPEVPFELNMVVSNFAPKRLRANTVDLRRDIAPVMRGLRHLGGLDSQIKLKMTMEPEHQLQIVQRLSMNHADLFRQMFVDLPSGTPALFEGLDPEKLGKTFVFQGDCGPIYVLVRRQR